MYRRILRTLQAEVSGERAFFSLSAIAQHHRIQASPGYRAAAEWCQTQFQHHSIAASITSYPATGRHWHWGSLVPREWHCHSAQLWGLSGGRRTARLCDFGEIPLSLIQRSAATPQEGVEVEVVAVSQPELRATYAGGALRGKAILVGNCNLMRVAVLAEAHGVAGIVTDNMNIGGVRTLEDVADARQYTSFWWWQGARPSLWGFVLSPRQGAALRRQLAEGPVLLWAQVHSEFIDGTIDNVEAVIPGTGDGEVLLVSHLCHPRPSANDNAGGPATVLEVARALRSLIDRGELPRPRRTIRCLLPPEMTGTYAYLSTDERALSRVVAALNLDMVSQNQDRTGSVLVAEYPPLACPSFTGDLLTIILGDLADLKNHPFRWTTSPFSGGSDHYILADPSVGIPCPMVINWPDRYYHTSFDTPDRADPRMLTRVAILAGTYIYFLASAGTEEAAWLAGEMVAAFPGKLHAAVVQAARRLAGRGAGREQARRDLEDIINFRLQRAGADVASLSRLVRGGDSTLDSTIAGAASDMAAAVDRERRRLTATLTAAETDAGNPIGAVPPLAPVPGALTLVPFRVVPGPVSLRELVLSRLNPEEQDAWHPFSANHEEYPLGTYLLYWCNGQRTLAEVCRLVELETGLRDDEFAARYMELLNRLRIIQWRRPGDAAD